MKAVGLLLHSYGVMEFGQQDKTVATKYNKQTNSVALVRKRTIPTERPPLVSEVSANFSG
jgi:hypothetical protein